MRKWNWRDILAWLLAAFFLAGSIGNTFVSEDIAADYARWGYPDWFHYVTALCELTTAVLLVRRPLRPLGAVLGSAVMLAATGTVILHGDYSRAVAPAVVLGVSVLVLLLTLRSRARSAGPLGQPSLTNLEIRK